MLACLSISPEAWKAIAGTGVAVAAVAVPLALFWLLLERMGR